jgi:Ca2+-binding RTX toxin-like protein
MRSGAELCTIVSFNVFFRNPSMKTVYAKPTLEALESRLVPSTTLVNGTLTINTGGFNDTVTIEFHSGEKLRVTEVEYGRVTRTTVTEWNLFLVDVQRISATLGAGNDQFFNYTGIASTVQGGAGQDYLKGGIGSDSLYGGDGYDYLEGRDGNDYLFGDNGDDELYGGAGNDTLNGNAGADFMRGEAGNDQMYGHAGNDTMYGGDGDDLLFGDQDNDTLYGDGGIDYLLGGDGNDDLWATNDGPWDWDYLYGGAGADAFWVTSWAEPRDANPDDGDWVFMVS